MPRKQTLTLLLTMTLATAIGCQSSGPPPVDLRGTHWTLVGLGGQPPAPGTEITLQFESGGKATGNAGVNNYFGSYQSAAGAGGGTLSFGELGSSRMAGEPEPMKQETTYLDMLRQITGYRADTNLLELAIGNQPVLRYRKVRR